MGNMDWLAAGVSVIVAFVLGGLWYSPLLFGDRWSKLVGVTEEMARAGMGKTFGMAFAWLVVSALVFAYFVQGQQTLLAMLHVGVLMGVGIVLPSFGLNYAFERKPFELLAINGGYLVLQFALYGLVFGLI